MGWERRKRCTKRYYTRSIWRDGRVVREYVGGGLVGRIASEVDAGARDRRAAERAALQAELERLAGPEALLGSLDGGCRLLIEAAFLAAGYHKHDRGAWRLRRGRRG
jgi:hypothetical protein